MSTRSLLRLTAVCALALTGIVTAGPAAAAGRGQPTERGIVQSVSASRLVLTALDGSTVTVTIDDRTRVSIDGRPASILDVRPGYVAVVTYRGASGQPALEVEAFTTSSNASRPVGGVVRSVSASGLTLVGRGGKKTSVAASTVARVFVDGKLASLAAVRAGFVAVVRPVGGDLHDVFAFSPPRAKGARLYDGVVTSVSGRTLVLQARIGGTVRLTLGKATAIFVDGKPGSLAKIESGDLVVVRPGPRRQVWAFSVS